MRNIHVKKFGARLIVAMATAVACTLALAACGGGGDGENSSVQTSNRADEGIWSNDGGIWSNAPDANGLNNYTISGMQTVILSDGSYWGIYGSTAFIEGFGIGASYQSGILHGVAGVSGNNASGTYTVFSSSIDATANRISNGTYSGTASSQNDINLKFNIPSNDSVWTVLSSASFSMGYDGIYKQPASLAAIAGDYLSANLVATSCPAEFINPDGSLEGGCQLDTYTVPDNSNLENLTIAGSSLTLRDSKGDVVLNGTIAPHGNGTVNVFDVSLTTAMVSAIGIPQPASNVPVGTTYKGILFQTSSDLENHLEIVTTTADNSSAFFYMGSKQNL
jgi:hypothetical protein